MVALGSSFAAGPGIEPVVDDKAMRSGRNYAHLVAEDLGAALPDATVSGATTATILDKKQRVSTTRFAPQIDAVRTSTDLVTITAGGNDLGYLGALLGCAAANRVAHRRGDYVRAQRRGDAVRHLSRRRIEDRGRDSVRVIFRAWPRYWISTTLASRLPPRRTPCRVVPSDCRGYARCSRSGVGASPNQRGDRQRVSLAPAPTRSIDSRGTYRRTSPRPDLHRRAGVVRRSS
ncbi:hypothetical protein CH275_27110 [Rhodococcus sp. 06-235-1A]|uniref:GDSL-type esterase/lipase family protein n=1 Tax=Rhodococcus sp. 06-235-1A TaxID=2022508 RepID=UPI000B9B8F09|nr:GDSL-type esterase/lipase family protein [Rhodococcus sp. 06-235-1A]OZC95446.1 hypothetical protein CH275_27110 [Rhodococcus sp. 06-235-1A]